MLSWFVHLGQAVFRFEESCEHGYFAFLSCG